ncbi:MAG: SymE family type I addiction module toxin [Oscillospiraceae bacterium]|nr:SymE family type I addiction module toxin [Oscillospiraceae bacterium]
MAKKIERELKVCAMSGYNYKSVPAIRLMGQWLEAAGFHIGDPVLVKCEDGKLIISLDTARAELMEDEKEALGEKMGVTRRVVQKYINVLKEAGRIERVGGKRYGYWKIND